jgi:hypothetical protein
MRVSTQVAARLRTSSRAGPSRRSDGSASTLGARMSPLGSRRIGEGLQARGQILAQRAQRGAQHSLLVSLSLGRVWHEAEPLDAAEMLSFDRHLARRGDRRRHFTLIA